MSKAIRFLEVCKAHLGSWVCSLHTTESNQPAAIFREVKKMGYEFEEVAPNRWARSMYCPVCDQLTTHYKLITPHPVYSKQVRLLIDKKTRERILKIFDYRDAFTGATISSTAEINHKIPWTRLDEDVEARGLSEAQVLQHFQLLTREHNLLKDRACAHCKVRSQRPPFLGIPFWYEGGEAYTGSCDGCGWFDGIRWRAEVALRLRALAIDVEEEVCDEI